MADDRHAQLKALYHVDFPDELFELWRWHQSLDADDKKAFAGVLGLGLNGPVDVLAGKFDNRDLRYPACLHWRYQYDPPEFITVMTGDTDGLHWGYWFDDPGKLPPVVAHFYARDGVELVEEPSLFRALVSHVARCREGTLENKKYDAQNADAYDHDLAALEKLEKQLPSLPRPVKRTVAAMTPDQMGIVVAREQLGTWTKPKTVEREAVLATVEKEIAAGRPGTALLIGRALWDGNHAIAFDVLVRAYEALGREPLRQIAEAHRKHPALPSLDVLSYRRGDYSDLKDALANPADARTLTLRKKADLSELAKLTELEELALTNFGLSALPEAVARLSRLKVLNLWSNALTAFPLALPRLESAKLAQNKLVDLGELVNCKALVELDVMSNQIQRIPDAVRGLTRLTSLNLSGNPLEELPDGLTELTGLTYVALGKCPLKRFPDLAKLKNLKRLYLVGTGISADEVARLKAALPNAEILA